MSRAGSERFLLINTGSSSVKLTLWGGETVLKAQRLGADQLVDLRAFVGDRGVDAVTHRVVHAGDLQAHARITPQVEAGIRAASPLAPLHNPMALRYLAASQVAFGPEIPQLAAIDTAFYAELPAKAATYALPPEAGPARRVGFHGLAHAFMARRCLALDPRKPRRLVTLQLGAGCSATAILDGKAIDTSMGFSPSEGLMMATRAGDVDPGLLIHLIRTSGCSADDLDRMINQHGGLAGVAGYAGMPEVMSAAGRGDPHAALAVELYCYRVQKTLGAYAAALGGLDAIGFGGGVGENSAEIRRRILEPLAWLGLELDAGRNTGSPVDASITSPTSRIVAWVVAVDEAAQMARITRDLLRTS